MKYLSTKNSHNQNGAKFLLEIHDGLETYVESEFPKLLLLMNINGCLVHRTDQRVEFLKPKEPRENLKGTKWDRHVQMTKQKKHYVYFRDGYDLFL